MPASLMTLPSLAISDFILAMKVFGLPGGEGGARRPFVMPPEDEVERFTRGLLQLRLAEIDEMARAAGVAV